MSEAWDKDLHNCEKAHLRIFLSADIVGSTAYKQKSASNLPGTPPAWFGLVLLFYKLSEQTFAEKWADLAGSNSNYESDFCGESPELWKTIGDEVLFAKKVTHPGQAFLCLHAWMETLEVLRDELRASGLDVKSTAWVAEFPLKNQEIVLFRKSVDALIDGDQDYSRQNYENLVRYYNKDETLHDVLIDYIGPSIDTGFRLGGYSSSRKLVISVELAYILGNEQMRDNANRTYASGRHVLPDLIFKYEGRFSLKGVLNSDPYPIIWLDLDPDNVLVKAEEAVLRTPHPTATEIRTLTEAYIKSHELLGFPYIDGCNYPEYKLDEELRREALLERHKIVRHMQHSSKIEKEMPDTQARASPEDPPPVIHVFWDTEELWKVNRKK